MEQERYDIEKDKNDFVYWFFSEGPRGRIKKGVRFRHMPDVGKNAFNLAFGDWEDSTKSLDDRVVSNNGDHLKVLHSVAEAVREFMNLWPDAVLHVRGSTSSRTRLYQMGIASFWKEISQEFEIWGKEGKEWGPFKKGVNYGEFLLFKKIN
ncbi:MAG: hypothetical protein BGO55_27250 [Sphingobacteriales bacterium 50-39]|nr:hypothetical protein [Sphingobacteriales bacterium]OJW56745.1 MAG: hypothetical protein BGO55_27250 [Sphingobacteriales bacterium 50-39]